ncbi:hypothetical protein FA13DRAFT_1735655 [Coprinellus micaceus]|uniref:Uncharacterized protein n=1 Tax=Coprinellus micaceus TaxID=71717 RepID=A0A4Y7T3G9_COPMI|nr:hypothetical protein FA13DRAFT_1735655 [Coprinellus micaceus]
MEQWRRTFQKPQPPVPASGWTAIACHVTSTFQSRCYRVRSNPYRRTALGRRARCWRWPGSRR